MKIRWMALVLGVSFFSSCTNAPKKNGVEEPKDSVAIVAPSTPEEQDELSEVITRFARAYVSKDQAKINALIHPDLGLYVIYRPGVSDTFVHVDSLDFSKPIPHYYDYEAVSYDYVLAYDKLPVYDCGREKWDKLGFICDTTRHPNQLSNIAAFEDEFEEVKFSDDDLEKLEIAESKSYRVIITAEIPLIFHVRKYEGKWYVTTLDRAYAGCDA